MHSGHQPTLVWNKRIVAHVLLLRWIWRLQLKGVVTEGRRATVFSRFSDCYLALVYIKGVGGEILNFWQNSSFELNHHSDTLNHLPDISPSLCPNVLSTPLTPLTSCLLWQWTETPCGICVLASRDGKLDRCHPHQRGKALDGPPHL